MPTPIAIHDGSEKEVGAISSPTNRSAVASPSSPSTGSRPEAAAAYRKFAPLVVEPNDCFGYVEMDVSTLTIAQAEGAGYTVAAIIADTAELVEQAEALANLFAAAPDLYEAMSEAEKHFGPFADITVNGQHDPDDVRVVALIRAALTKATGAA